MIVLLRSLSPSFGNKKAALAGRLRGPSMSGVAGEPVVGPSGAGGSYKRRANWGDFKNPRKSFGWMMPKQ
jgi:hypothetical protein